MYFGSRACTTMKLRWLSIPLTYLMSKSVLQCAVKLSLNGKEEDGGSVSTCLGSGQYLLVPRPVSPECAHVSPIERRVTWVSLDSTL